MLPPITQLEENRADRPSSIKATRALSKSLEATFEVARPLRIELAEWLQDHPEVSQQPSEALLDHGLDGSGSLRLAYITAKIAVFKALLRPKNNEAPIEARNALRTGAMAVARETYDFLAKLGPHHLEAFWHSCELAICLVWRLASDAVLTAAAQILESTLRLPATSSYCFSPFPRLQLMRRTL